MAISEFELKRVEKLATGYIEAHRPPAHIRSQVDIGFRITGQSLELFEIRPRWNNPTQKIEEATAKATYVKKTKSWKIFWQRADLKWHGYEPHPKAKTIEEFLEIVDRDEHACFFG